jgi:HD superfamily phosphohydrolase
MYWQVYLHKTVIAAEQLLCKIFNRSRELALNGAKFMITPALNHFLDKVISKEEFVNSPHHLETFALLDDTDVMAAVKVWADSDDFVLATLCHNFINRKLFHVDITSERPDEQLTKEFTVRAVQLYNIYPQ